jgi:hypothetical protein
LVLFTTSLKAQSQLSESEGINWVYGTRAPYLLALNDHSNCTYVCPLLADFVAEVGDQCGWALNRLFLKLSVADRSIGSGGFDAMAPTPTTAMPRTWRLLVVVGRPSWRAGVGSVR